MAQKAILLTTIRENITEDVKNHINVISTFTPESKQTMIRYRFKAMCDKFEKLEGIYEKIESCAAIDAETVKIIATEKRQLEDAFFMAKARCIELAEDLDDSAIEQPQNALQSTFLPPTLDGHNIRIGPKLQPIALTKFSGKGEDWTDFEELFTALVINNATLNNVQKMRYLKTSLQDEPAKVIKYLPLTGESFTKSWALLKSAYHNKRIIVEENLSRFFALPTFKEHAAEGLRHMINTTNNMLTAVELQGVPVNNWIQFWFSPSHKNSTIALSNTGRIIWVMLGQRRISSNSGHSWKRE